MSAGFSIFKHLVLYQCHGSILSGCTAKIISMTFVCGYLDGSCHAETITTDRLVVNPFHGAQCMG